MENIQITTAGVKAQLVKFDLKKAIAEFIWNGFDAQASCVNLIYKTDEIGRIAQVKVVDNGYGIDKDKLDQKFKPVFESDKVIDPDLQRNTSAAHGKNGVGRLTFFKFANEASWNTTYRSNGVNLNYTIHIDSNTLNSYDNTPPQATDKELGTTVTFLGLITMGEHVFKTEIREYLRREFCWFLELHNRKPYSLLINGEPLDYSKNVGDRALFTFGGDPFSFEIDYVRWNTSLNNEYSRYYYIDAQDNEKFKETTRLNNQGDKFFHSVYIRSTYFNDVKRPTSSNNGSELQPDLLGLKRSEKIFKDLINHINTFLREKRKPFLAESTSKLIVEFQKEQVFPHRGNTEWDNLRRYQLEQAVKGIYQYEPKVFAGLNLEQKKIITHLLDLIIDADEKDRLLEIIGDIIKLTPQERAEFAHILQATKMSSIIKTIRLIEDRMRAIDQIKQLVFKPELNANERDHVQKFVEQHYWIFGEQYHLVTAEEPKFEEALRRYVYLLRGEDTNPTIDHPDKNKEMDIFMVRRLMLNDKINCVVVELKSPTISLGEKELRQVKKYFNVIRRQSEFNAANNTWEFFLVGNRFDTSGYIEDEITNAQHHGEKSLVYKVDNYKIYVKTWSEIFNEFDIRHNFLLEKLQTDRSKIHVPATSANGVVVDAKTNGAALPGQIII